MVKFTIVFPEESHLEHSDAKNRLLIRLSVPEILTGNAIEQNVQLSVANTQNV